MPRPRAQPPTRDRPPDPQPRLEPETHPSLLGFHAGLGEEGPPVLPEDPRQARRAGPIGQAEQAKEQGVLVRVDEQRQETLRARILRTLRLRQRRLRHGTQQKHRRHRVQGQVLVAQHEPPGVSPEGERSAQGAGAGLEQGIGGEVGDFRGLEVAGAGATAQHASRRTSGLL